jgi:hypothetical protein
MPERIIALAREMSDLARGSVANIQAVTTMTRMLSLNALIEAGRAGEAGKGFSIVAKEVRSISEQIDKVATGLGEKLVTRATEIDRVGKKLVAAIRGTRLTDLALNMIEIIDRNLYERSCDVRWWATDSAVVDVATDPQPQRREFAASRLGVILDSYTVYLDIWVCDLQGNVLANGRPGKFQVKNVNVAGQSWFKRAMATKDGTEFAVDDIYSCEALGKRLVGTYSAAVREGAQTNGRPTGVLAIFFDWQTQSQAVVDGVRLADDERGRTRCLIVDSRHKVIASSDRCGILAETFALQTNGQPRGNYSDEGGGLVGYALTPGYESYRGLGWYGVISQSPTSDAGARAAA